MKLGKINTPWIPWRFYYGICYGKQVAKMDSHGFMHKEMPLKKMSNFMHCRVLISIQTQGKDLDVFAAISLLSRCQE